MPPKGPKAAPKAAGKKGPPAAMLAKIKAQLEFQKAEEERVKREQEEEEQRLREEERLAEEQRRFEEEEAKRRKEEQKAAAKVSGKAKKKNAQAEKLEQMRAAGMIIPDVPPTGERPKATPAPAPRPKPKPKPKAAEQERHVDPFASSSGEDIDEDDWEAMAEKEARQEERRKQRAVAMKQRAVADAAEAIEAENRARNVMYGDDIDFHSDLRSPICCILGHVDTGKTSLLDKIRSTNVQKGEAGGITQQIGATFFPRVALMQATEELNKKHNHELKVPGLLVIDTPGHESFTNLRSRGSTLCDIAVLVIDIMHGLEQQTRESIQLLKDRKCPFIVALNKVDRLYDWVSHPWMDIEQSLAKQKSHVLQEYETRVANAILQLNECGLNAELYYKNKDVRKFVSVVPTSAHTGEGIPDLLLLKMQLVQRFMEGKVTFKDDLQCTVLEVKPIQGIGTTIDVVLVNGTLHEGDHIVVCGMSHAIKTQIRALLTPQPLKELRVRGDYVHHKKVKAALGIKIVANDLEEAVPGTQLAVIKASASAAEIEAAKREVQKDMNSVIGAIKKSDIGVTVQSSTLGSLEALMAFLKDSDIPVSAVALGPMHRRHLLQTISMRERNPKFAVVLAFDVAITREAQEAAEQNNIRIFSANIIYHLFDAFKKYCKEYEERLKEKNSAIAVFPVQMKVTQNLHAREPMIMGCFIERGHLRIGTKLCIMRPVEIQSTQDDSGQQLPEGLGEDPAAAAKPKKKSKAAAQAMRLISVGKVVSIQHNGKDETSAKHPAEVAVKVSTTDRSLAIGNQFDIGETLLSEISRESIDALKESFRDDMSTDDWNFVKELKKMQGVKDPIKKAS